MTPPSPIVGIIANPASGRDLRRLTAHAGLHSSTDKASVVQRLLAAFGATGIRHALLPPDMTGIAAAVLRASQTRQARDGHWPFLEFLDMPLRQSVEDTRLAARRMVERGVALIAVLGGDGTHKAVAAEVGDVLAGAVHRDQQRFPGAARSRRRGARRRPLRQQPGAAGDRPATQQAPAGARAAPRALRVGAGGRRGVAAAVHRRPRHQSRRRPRRSLRQLRRTPRHRPFGALRTVVAGEPRSPTAPGCACIRTPASLLVPLAPGLLVGCGVSAAGYLQPGVAHAPSLSSGTLALDGEREIEFSATDRPSITLDPSGPFSVDVPATLAYAARHRLLAGQRTPMTP